MQPQGPGTVVGTFTQDNFYQSSSDEAETMIFAFLPTGSFTVGDLSAVPDATVTFWDAQWHRANGLSGGVAPASFKGFINSLTPQPPMCGGTWTTAQGGNSVDPPSVGVVPEYMGVVVATNITKSGNTTAGDIARIVVVRTNGRYAPNPGHAGTGAVVAQYCP